MRLAPYVVALASLLASCKETPKVVETSGPPASMAGTWKWVCCGGKYSGTLTLTQSGADVKGTMSPSAETAALVLSSDSIISYAGPVTGRIDGTILMLDRTTTNGSLHIALRGDATGDALDGNFEGPHDATASTDLVARRILHATP